MESLSGVKLTILGPEDLLYPLDKDATSLEKLDDLRASIIELMEWSEEKKAFLHQQLKDYTILDFREYETKYVDVDFAGERRIIKAKFDILQEIREHCLAALESNE